MDFNPGSYNIQGSLPFTQQANPGAMFSGNPADLGSSYNSAYSAALGQNAANYGNIMSGYQQTMQNQIASQNQQSQGYQNLYNTVMGGIQGIDQSQRQAIQDQYAQQSGGLTQQLSNSGLGNTTVAGSMMRGVDLDRSKADIALSNQTAQLQAGYQSNLGLAGLNYQNQANMQNTALAGQQLGFMNSVNSLYPNAQQYGQLGQQAGQFSQMNQDRGQVADQFRQQMNARGAGGGGGGSLPTSRSPMASQDPMGAGGGGYAGMGASVTPYGLSGNQSYGLPNLNSGGIGASAFGQNQGPGGLGGIAGGAINGMAAYLQQQDQSGANVPVYNGGDYGDWG